MVTGGSPQHVKPEEEAGGRAAGRTQPFSHFSHSPRCLHSSAGGVGVPGGPLGTESGDEVDTDAVAVALVLLVTYAPRETGLWGTCEPQEGWR